MSTVHPGGKPGVSGEIPGGKPEVFGGTGEPIEAAYRVAGEAAADVALVPLATMVEELRGLADQLAELARRNEGLALGVGTLRERQVGQEGQLAAKDAMLAAKDQALAADALALAELRRRAEAAEAALSTVVDTHRPQAAPAARDRRKAHPSTNPGGEPGLGFWARVRRVWGGGTTGVEDDRTGSAASHAGHA